MLLLFNVRYDIISSGPMPTIVIYYYFYMIRMDDLIHVLTLYVYEQLGIYTLVKLPYIHAVLKSYKDCHL